MLMNTSNRISSALLCVLLLECGAWVWLELKRDNIHVLPDAINRIESPANREDKVDSSANLNEETVQASYPAREAQFDRTGAAPSFGDSIRPASRSDSVALRSELMEELKQELRQNEIDAVYGLLYQTLDLSLEDRVRLRKLLQEQQMLGSELSKSVHKILGAEKVPLTKEEFNSLLQGEKNNLLQDLSQLLGPSGLSALTAYQEKLNEHAFLAEFQQVASGSGSQLSMKQANRLASVLFELRGEPDKPTLIYIWAPFASSRGPVINDEYGSFILRTGGGYSVDSAGSVLSSYNLTSSKAEALRSFLSNEQLFVLIKIRQQNTYRRNLRNELAGD